MDKIETLLENSLIEANLSNYFIDNEVLYMIIENEPTIEGYLDSEGNIDYEYLFSITGKEICSISEIKNIKHINSSIVIKTYNCKIILKRFGYFMTSLF